MERKKTTGKTREIHEDAMTWFATTRWWTYLISTNTMHLQLPRCAGVEHAYSLCVMPGVDTKCMLYAEAEVVQLSNSIYEVPSAPLGVWVLCREHTGFSTQGIESCVATYRRERP